MNFLSERTTPILPDSVESNASTTDGRQETTATDGNIIANGNPMQSQQTNESVRLKLPHDPAQSTSMTLIPAMRDLLPVAFHRPLINMPTDP